MFQNLRTDGLEETQDVVVGSNSGTVPTNVYAAIIKMAYVSTATSGAMAVNVVLMLPALNREHRETIYVTNKAGQNFYTDKHTHKRVPLPGFVTVDEMCLIASNTPLSEQQTENKTVKLYDFELKKEVPTEVPVMVSLLDAEIEICLVHLMENKKVKNANGDYVPTADVRESNTVEKILDPASHRTVNETLSDSEPKFHDLWLDKHKDTVRDKRTIKDATAAAKPAAGAKPVTSAPSATGAPTKKLFGNK
jgi:hypothetical protein